MWLSMYRFIVLGTLFSLLTNPSRSHRPGEFVDALVDLLKDKQVDIVASNVDVLFQFPCQKGKKKRNINKDEDVRLEESRYEAYIEFAGPRDVRVIKQRLPSTNKMEDKVLVRSICSLISTGCSLSPNSTDA